jgi:Predicted thioesterase
MHNQTKIHEITTRVRYQETDQMGIVYYANFFVYFEMGRTEYLRNIGLPYAALEKEHIYFPVTERTADFAPPPGMMMFLLSGPGFPR